VGLARATIEKISGRARTASSDFFIVLTSRKTSYYVVRAPEILRTLPDAGKRREVAFFVSGAGGCKLTLIRRFSNDW
jgi:hypothetical protein